MLSNKPKIMSLNNNMQSEVTFRIKPEPCRVVSFSSLNKTKINHRAEVNNCIVNFDGNLTSDSWQPISSNSRTIEISTSGWDGLVSRYFESKLVLAEVA